MPPFPSKTLKTVTLGCKVNQYETEYVRQGLERLGYREAAAGEEVDLLVVNTCAVTTESEAKSRKTIRRLAKLHSEAKIVVMGCYAARAPDEAAALPDVVEVVADKRALPEFLRRWGLADVPRGIERFAGRRRALVKIQDGCQGNCSYCIIPKTRPYRFNRPEAEVLDEVRGLVAHGHREIVLTGVHLGRYGDSGSQEANGGCRTPPLVTILRRITDLDGEFRVRLSSVEAGEVTPELLRLMAERRDRICPHLHIPLQSGSNAVLARMNRRLPIERFAQKCRDVRAAVESVALTTDVIVGFPGETEADFADTCRVVEELGFAKVHVFRFSRRPGTPAATMARQVPERIVQHRARRLGGISRSLRDRALQELVGRRLQVLIEGRVPGRPGWMGGFSEQHAPVIVPSDRGALGQFVEMVATHFENGWLR